MWPVSPIQVDFCWLRSLRLRGRSPILALCLLTSLQLLGCGGAQDLHQGTGAREQRLRAESLSAEAMKLQEAGDAHSLELALETHRQVLAISRSLQEPTLELNTLLKLGKCHYALNQAEQSLRYFQLALPLSQELEDPKTKGELLNNMGMASWRQGDPNEALEKLDQAQRIWEQLRLPYQKAATLSNLGLLHWHVGEWQRALQHYLEALEVVRSTANPQGEALVLNNIGLLYFSLGELDSAIEYLREALDLFRQSGKEVEAGRTLSTLGRLHLAANDPQKARDLLEKSLLIFRESGERRSEAEALNFLGLAREQAGHREQALAHYRRALAGFEAVGDRRGAASTLHNLGVLFSRAGDFGKAWSYLSRALEARRALHLKDQEAETLFRMARVESDQGQLEAARTRIERVLILTESLRAKAAGQDLRASYLAERLDYYKFQIDLLMRLHAEDPRRGFEKAAFRVAERSRARSLLEMLGELPGEIRRNADPQLLHRERLLQRELNFQSTQWARFVQKGAPSDEGVALRRRLDSITTEYQQVESQLRAASPRHAALTRVESLDLEEVQDRVLDKETILLEYSLDERSSYLWAVTQGDVWSFILPNQDTIERAARSVFELSSLRGGRTSEGRQRFQEAAADLSQILFGPVADQLRGKRLLIVPEGALQYVPFAALPIPGRSREEEWRPLVLEHEIVTLPSASTLTTLREQVSERPRPPGTVAVLADPVFDRLDSRVQQVSSAWSSAASFLDQSWGGGKLEATSDPPGVTETGDLALSRLPFSRREAQGIVALAPQDSSFLALDFLASKEIMTSPKLREYGIIHISTHGLVNATHPELSSLVFSMVDREGRKKDGFLGLHEIYNLRLGADLVVLSACQSGLGKEIRGEGLVGMTRGFMYAGAARVLVSLWKVDDEATAELMKHFYQGLLGKERLTPAAALRKAQLEVRHQRRWQSPYYWAGFVFQGEWR